MSEPHARVHPSFARNYATHQEGSPLARAVHGYPATVRIALFSITVGFGGCVIPPSLSVDNEDAGINSPPAILAVRSADSELPEPGPVIFERGAGAGTLNVQLIDTDIQDTLYVRVFVDYTVDTPTAPRATCTAAPTGNSQRTVTCSLNALCLMADVGQRRDMHITVFDREPLEAGEPPFQAMPMGGLTTNRFYFLDCKDPPT